MTLQYQGRKSGEIFELGTGKAYWLLSPTTVVWTLEYGGNKDFTHMVRVIFSGSFTFNDSDITKSSITDLTQSSLRYLRNDPSFDSSWSVHFGKPNQQKPNEWLYTGDLNSATEVNYAYAYNGRQFDGGNTAKLLANHPVSQDRSVLSGYSWSSLLKDNWWVDAFSSSSQGSGIEPNITLNKNYDVSEVLASLAVSTQSGTFQTEISDRSLTINASSWTGSIKINFAAKAAAQGERLDAKQIDFASSSPTGSILQGGDGNDQLWGKAGWDVFDGGKGNDLIRAGNGRDILTGGSGADELHGDFGWNTYKSEKDGFSDLIAIKSDQHLSNWIYGKAGNNPNGEKADIIEGLDANDKIRIIGVFSPDITVRAGATAHGVSGIGIYAKGALEALYTGGDLSVAQLTAMTSGDGSAAAMANQVSSYGWTGV